MILYREHKLRAIKDYKKFLTKEEYENILEQVEGLRGKKVIHVNATATGGGVAEILKTLVPLEKSTGLKSDWYYLEPDSEFFDITKKLHNSLQGGEKSLSKEEKEYYLNYNRELAERIMKMEPDLLIVHDPQPLPVIKYIKNIPAISRIHIDSTQPNPDSRDFILSILNMYDRVVFSLDKFAPEGIDKNKLVISPPAIDPLSSKNDALGDGTVRKILISSGVKPDKPLMAQISRFDKWKDPLGVIETYYKVKKEIPDMQLILVGVIEASDDPEAEEVLKEVQKKAKGDPDIYLISTPEQRGEATGRAEAGIFENAIQRGADVVLQKSIREGFGLTVTEAMWKKRPVIGGNVGGIALQIEDGVNGFLVDSTDEAAKKTIKLFKHPNLARKIGKNAKETVRKNFLVTRFLEDELKIMQNVLYEKN